MIAESLCIRPVGLYTCLAQTRTPQHVENLNGPGLLRTKGP